VYHKMLVNVSFCPSVDFLFINTRNSFLRIIIAHLFPYKQHETFSKTCSYLTIDLTPYSKVVLIQAPFFIGAAYVSVKSKQIYSQRWFNFETNHSCYNLISFLRADRFGKSISGQFETRAKSESVANNKVSLTQYYLEHFHQALFFVNTYMIYNLRFVFI